MPNPYHLLSILSKYKMRLSSEKELQADIEESLQIEKILYEREYRMGPRKIIDFRCYGKVGLEVKIKGTSKSIFRQIEGYLEESSIDSLLLISNKAMNVPPKINGKPVYVLLLGNSWL